MPIMMLTNVVPVMPKLKWRIQTDSVGEEKEVGGRVYE